MKTAFRTLLLVCLLTLSQAVLGSKPVVLFSPADYQVLAISPNGKWACGVYNDYNYMSHAFRWNLETDEMLMLGNPMDESEAWSINDAGTAVGRYTDYKVMENGVGAFVPGYFSDGEWHMLELPKGYMVDDTGGNFFIGEAFGISADGRYISGSVVINWDYCPFVWEDGKVLRKLDINNNGDMASGMPHCISPDGQTVGGWSLGNFSRACTLWNTSDGKRRIISDYQWIDAETVRFSPDGKKVILSVGPDKITGDAKCIYDLETGETSSLPAGASLFGISGSYTCVGSGPGGAVMYPNGKGPAVLLSSYLAKEGVKFSDYSVVSLFRAQDISADDNILAILTYAEDEDGFQSLHSMIVKLNQDDNHSAPVKIEARQLEALNTVALGWSAPLVEAENVEKYNIYCDNTLAGSVDGNVTEYYAKNLSQGEHTFVVAAMYKDGTEMKAQTVSVTVKEKAVSTPENMMVRKKGMFGAWTEWDEPLSNHTDLKWYNPANVNLKGFGNGQSDVDIEMGIGFKASELENYAGSMLKKVQFYPMSEQKSWTLRVYEYQSADVPTLVYEQPITQTLRYGQRNTVVLTEPLPVSGKYDMIIALGVEAEQASVNILGIDFGRCRAGYSDLIRMHEEPDFYSFYALSALYGTMQYDTFLIDAILASADGSEEKDIVDHYSVLVDGNELLQTKQAGATIAQLADGGHKIGVKAVYADGRESAVQETGFQMKGTPKRVNKLDVKQTGSDAVKVTWSAPVDDDATTFGYSSDTPATTADNGPMGAMETNYAITAGVLFDADMMRGYDGYKIKSFSFYPTADAVFTFLLYEDYVFKGEIEVDDYELDQWNEVLLPEPITVGSSHSYILALDCYDVTPEKSPVAMDSRLPFVMTSDLVSVDGGNTWSSVADEGGLYGNWLLRMNLEAAEPMPSKVKGYDLRVDYQSVASDLLQVTEYEYSGVKEANRHNARVNCHYEGLENAVMGELNYFTMEQFDGILLPEQPETAVSARYDLMGRKVDAKAKGLLLQRNNDGKTTKIIIK